MDWKKELFDKNEKPIDRLADGYSHTFVFRIRCNRAKGGPQKRR